MLKLTSDYPSLDVLDASFNVAPTWPTERCCVRLSMDSLSPCCVEVSAAVVSTFREPSGRVAIGSPWELIDRSKLACKGDEERMSEISLLLEEGVTSALGTNVYTKQPRPAVAAGFID